MAKIVLLVGFEKSVASSILSMFPDLKIKAVAADLSYRDLWGYVREVNAIFFNGDPAVYFSLVRNDSFIKYPGDNMLSYSGPVVLDLEKIWQLFNNRQVYIFGLPHVLHISSLQKIAAITGAKYNDEFGPDRVSLNIKLEHQNFLAGFIFRQLFAFLPETFTHENTSCGKIEKNGLFDKSEKDIRDLGSKLQKLKKIEYPTLRDFQNTINSMSDLVRNVVSEAEDAFRKSRLGSYNGVVELKLDENHPLRQLYPEYIDRPLHKWLEAKPLMQQPLSHIEYYMGYHDQPVRQLRHSFAAPEGKVFLLPPPESIEDIFLPMCAILGDIHKLVQTAPCKTLTSIPKGVPGLTEEQSRQLQDTLSKIGHLKDEEGQPVPDHVVDVPVIIRPSLRELYKIHYSDKEFPIIGESLALELLYRQIVPVLNDKTGHVLILGEAGSGKELIADIIMKWHEGCSNSMNCAHLPVTLAHSLLFGHVKGAFTNAIQDNSGYIGENKKGYLFMDEIEALPVEVMPMLLRYLESGEFQRVGDPKIRRSSVKIIGASNDDAILQGKFLLRGFISRFRYVVRVPSLKYRRRDIPLLVQHFTEKAIKELELFNDMSISEQQIGILQDTDWSHSNVRGLKNAVYNLLSRQVSYGSSPVKGKESKQPGRPSDFDDKTLLKNFKKSKDVKELKESLEIEIKGKYVKRYQTKPAMRQRIGDNHELKRLFEEKFAKDY